MGYNKGYVMSNYSALIQTWTNNLMWIYKDEPIGVFWRMLKLFISSLETEVKEKVWPEVLKVEDAIDKRYNSVNRNNIDMYAKKDLAKRKIYPYLERESLRIYNLVHSLLDEGGLKKITRRKVGGGDLG